MTQMSDSQEVWENAVPRLDEAHSDPNPQASEQAAMEDDIVRRALAMHDAVPNGYGSEGGSAAGLRATNPVPSGE